MAKEITLRFTSKEIQEKLKKVFKAEHQELMSECIVGVLSENHDALERVFKASLNIHPVLEYKMGDTVSIRKVGLTDYLFNVEKMIEEGLIANDHMVALISGTQPYSNYPYQVTYKYINAEGETHEYTSDVHQMYIAGLSEEFPLEL
jgi:hypothetical protein